MPRGCRLSGLRRSVFSSSAAHAAHLRWTAAIGTPEISCLDRPIRRDRVRHLIRLALQRIVDRTDRVFI